MQEHLKTGLRAVEPGDESVLATMRGDVALQKRLLGSREPVTEPVADWIARRHAAGWIAAVEDGEGQCIGYVQIASIHRSNRTGWFGIVLAASARGGGHGAGATRLALDHARDVLGLRKVLLSVRADNPAVRLYARLGFRHVGTLKDEYDSGDALFDVELMEYLFEITP